MDVRFILCDPKNDLCKKWVQSINSLLIPEQRSHFTIHNGVLSDIKESFDCIVSPANSYGKLDGAMDLVISKMFCLENYDAVVNHCQEYLYSIYNGFQPTGTALLIPMHPFSGNIYKCKWIMHCPTMRTPSNCTWNKEVVYNCMWSLLCELWRQNTVKSKNEIKTVFITGLGTGIGNFPSETCAQQMILAYKHFLSNLSKTEKCTSWQEIKNLGLDIDGTCRNRAFS